MHVIGFIVRIYQDAPSSECPTTQVIIYIYIYTYIYIYITADGQQSVICFDRLRGHLQTVFTKKMCKLFNGMSIWVLRTQS